MVHWTGHGYWHDRHLNVVYRVIGLSAVRGSRIGAPGYDNPSRGRSSRGGA